jgi:hypothetical protein
MGYPVGTKVYIALADCFHPVNGISLRIYGGQSFRTNRPVTRCFRKWKIADGPEPERTDFEDIDPSSPPPEPEQIAIYKIDAAGRTTLQVMSE